MKKITVSAPGKLMLLGEHAVVYNHPCIVTSVGQRMYVTIEQTCLPARQGAESKEKRPELIVNAPDVNIEHYAKPLSELGKGDIPRGVLFLEIAVKNFSDKFPISEGLSITTKSEFSSLLGFGSSSAATVCVIKALDELFETKLSNKDMFDLSYKVVIDIQKKGSGFDVAAAIYGGTLYFMTGGKEIKQIILPSRHPGKSERSGDASRISLEHEEKFRDSGPRPRRTWLRQTRLTQARMTTNSERKIELPLIVGYSGIKADTVTLINKVSELSKQNPSLVKNIYKDIAGIVGKARIALEKKDWQELGRLMNENQKHLVKLGVSIDKLDAMIKAARDAGAYGAKLSGAGGGDCMIALRPAQGKLAIEKAITKAGGEYIDVETNVEGARVE